MAMAKSVRRRRPLRRALVALAAAVACASPAAAMSVADFLAKARALEAKGMAAMFSSDFGVLKREITNASTAYRAGLANASKAGQTPHSCPPPKGKAKLDSNELIADFARIPAAQQQRTSVSAAFLDFMARKYPCAP